MNKSRLVFVATMGVVLAAALGYFAGKHGDTMTKSGTPAAGTTAARKPLYWVAPMDPHFRRDQPGKSPMGMDLVPVYPNSEDGSDASDVKIDPAVVENLGVRTVEVQRGEFAKRLEAVGYVAYDEDSVVSVNTRADGWIEKLAVKSMGDTVRPGQLLYELFSPKLATAEREYLTALTSGSQSLIAASGERMHALGFSAAQIAQLTRAREVSDRIARRADTAGVIVSLGVSEGAYVMPATQVMKLADLRVVWVLVEVDESDAALLHTGQDAVADFNAFPGQRWKGTVDYIYPDLSAVTRTVRVRLRFANSDLRLQPNMYGHVTLQAAAQQDVLTIPNEALIRTGQSERVIVALGKGRFDVCPVKSGLSSGDQVQILEGLRQGQSVVTSAQFMIDSEANVDSAALRLGSGKPACTSTSAMPNPGGTDHGLADPDSSDGMTEMSDKTSPSKHGDAMKGMAVPRDADHPSPKSVAAPATDPTTHKP